MRHNRLLQLIVYTVDVLFQTEFSKDAVVKVKLGSGLGSLVSLIKK